MSERRTGELVEISVPYGKERMTCTIPRQNLAEILCPRNVHAPADAQDARIREALENPIGAPRLEARVNGSSRIALIMDDATRPTPTARILPHVLGRLREAGVRDENITVVIALGTHRPMTDPEIADKVGGALGAGIRVENHNFKDHSKLVEVGRSEDGIPIWINRSVMEADFRIGIGNIVPHGVAGWSGGGKIVYPGVAGERTVDAFHGAFGMNMGNRIGNIDAPIRKEIERLVRFVGLEFIVNTILTGDGIIYRVVAGDYILAHRAGVAFARDVYAVKGATRADVAIVSSYPADADFWQAGKAVYAGELIIRDGGTLILVTPCPEGIAQNHNLLSYMGRTPEELREKMRAFQIDDRAAAAVAIRIGSVCRRVKVVVVSEGLSRPQIEGLGFHHAAALQEALEYCMADVGKACKVSVLTHGGDTYPETESTRETACE